jgi:trehalose/maltose hydrolase-like predicted phosphorylase
MTWNENLLTNGPWDIHEVRFDPEQLVNTASNFLIGNGYVGYRGTIPDDTASDIRGMRSHRHLRQRRREMAGTGDSAESLLRRDFGRRNTVELGPHRTEWTGLQTRHQS